jgi:hypothetical protein
MRSAGKTALLSDKQEEPAMTDPCEPPRPRDDALQEELDALHEQEREGHWTPKEQRRAEQLERRLSVDEHRAEVREHRRRIAMQTARIRRNAPGIAPDLAEGERIRPRAPRAARARTGVLTASRR